MQASSIKNDTKLRNIAGEYVKSEGDLGDFGKLDKALTNASLQAALLFLDLERKEISQVQLRRRLHVLVRFIYNFTSQCTTGISLAPFGTNLISQVEMIHIRLSL